MAGRFVEGLDVVGARVQFAVDGVQLRCDFFPVVQRVLQGGADGGDGAAHGEAAVDHHQLAVAAAVFQGRQLHACTSGVWSSGAVSCIQAACWGALRVSAHSLSMSHLTASSFCIISGVPVLTASSRRWPLGAKNSLDLKIVWLVRPFTSMPSASSVSLAASSASMLSTYIASGFTQAGVFSTVPMV